VTHAVADLRSVGCDGYLSPASFGDQPLERELETASKALREMIQAAAEVGGGSVGD
jgi:hypothetical protein